MTVLWLQIVKRCVGPVAERVNGSSGATLPVVLVLAACLAHIPAGAADWPVYRGDAQLRGQVGEALGDALALLWTFDSGAAYLGSPVVADGRVYVGSSEDALVCLDLSTGKTLWTYDAGDDIDGAPLIAGDVAVVGTAEGIVHAVNRVDGRPRWTFACEDKIVGGANSVKVDGQLRIVVGSHDMRVYCLDGATGKELWRFETNNFVNATPAVAPEGIVFGGCDGLLHVLDPADGKERAAIKVGSYVAASVAVDGGKAFLGHYGGEVLCIDLQKEAVTWRFSAGRRAEPFFAPPAVLGDAVIAGNRDGTVRRLDRESGSVRWKFTTRQSVEAGAVIARGRCFVGSSDGRIYALDMTNGNEVWSYEIGAGVVQSPAVSGQRLLVSAEDGVLYVFGPARNETPPGP